MNVGRSMVSVTPSRAAATPGSVSGTSAVVASTPTAASVASARRISASATLETIGDEAAISTSAVRTGSGTGRSAIWKLGGALDDEQPPVSAHVPDRPELPVIRAAVASRSTITFGYRGSERHLDPWGLLLRGGFWYVAGFDRDRGEERTFRVDRFDGGASSIVVGPPGEFERPADFDPRSAFPADPKQIGQSPDEAIEATVRIDAGRAAAAVRELGDDRVLHRHDDGSIDVRVPADNIDAFRSWVLGLLEHAVVVDPPELRASIVAWLTAVAAAGSETRR